MAISIVFGGVSAASVFGVPLSNYIGIALGWHNAFWLMAILSAIALVGILLLIPRIHSNSAIGIASLKHVFQSATLRKIYLATLIVITAHFAAFTFIEPWLQMQQLFPSTYIPIALFTFGIAGLLGNFITGFTIDKFLKPTVSISIILMSFTLLYLGLNQKNLSQITIFTCLVVWGLAVSGIFVGFQTWVLKLADKEVFPASAIYVSCFNLAIGLGAILGAWGVAQFPISQLYLYAGLIIAGSILLILMIPSNNR